MTKFKNLRCLMSLILLLISQHVFAHVSPEHSQPGAGAVLAQPPETVNIKFNGTLEPTFSHLIVQDVHGQQVSVGKGDVNAAAESTVLTTTLDNIQSGQYHVFWQAVSRDGHRTKGDYTFTVE